MKAAVSSGTVESLFFEILGSQNSVLYAFNGLIFVCFIP